MRPVLGLLIAFAVTSPACVCSSAVELDRGLLDGEPDAGPGALPDAAPEELPDAGPEPCPAGWSRCASGCVDTDADPMACGGCGNACGEGSICVAGGCVGLCADEDDKVLWCLERCVDPMEDEHHCGACFRVCGRDERCHDGLCF